MSDHSHIVASPWPHRWAVVLACATFPLVWVGGLVTTTDAGMAVPDWPTTYGYNPLLYPWQSWLAGPWDLFVEHGHRLLAMLVGTLTIGLAIVLWRTERRRWVGRLGLAALALVIFQGVLGGMRVLLDERTLAMLHGCTGPLFFALTVALVVFTSRRWQEGATGDEAPSGAAANVRRVAVVTAILAYLQIVLGAVLRHVPVDSEPGTFVLAVWFHLIMAAMLVFHITWLVVLVLRHWRSTKLLVRLAVLLGVLSGVQVLLGASTWIVSYSVPQWAAGLVPLGGWANRAGGWLETHVVTAHAAVGSLLLATALVIALLVIRSTFSGAGVEQAAGRRLRAAP